MKLKLLITAARRKFGVTEECRRWRMIKNELRNMCTTRKAFRGPKSGRFPELEQQMEEFVQEKRNEGYPITREIIKMKAGGAKKKYESWYLKIYGNYWLVHEDDGRESPVLRRRTTLCQRLLSAYEGKILTFQRHVIGLRKQHEYFGPNGQCC